MSKVTLLDYKSMIDEKIKYIRNKINTENLQLEDFGGTVFSETLVAQYKMMRDYLNRNSLNKRFFSDDLENRELLNAYYSHMYMHNHIAFEDEVFEAIDAINSLKIGEKIGSCASAAYKKERVIVENINTHENWQDYLDLTQKANLHACWSQPIISSQNEVLGTFAIYNNVVKAPIKFN